MKKHLLLFAAMLAIVAIVIVSIPTLGIMEFTHPVYADANVCPVCGNLIGYGTQIKWETWTVWGFEKSGWVVHCDKCGYTTTRDASGNIPSPYFANKAWQAKMFTWIHNGWTHAQSLEAK